MSLTTWNATHPSSTSSANHGDDALREFASEFATAIGSVLSWPGSGGATALVGPKLGSLRLAQSSTNRAGGMPDGFLSWDPRAGGLRHIGSTWTGYIGGANLLEHATATPNAAWLAQSGTVTFVGTEGTEAVVFSTPYSVAPVIIQTASSQTFAVMAASVTTVGFTSLWSRLAGAGSGTAAWRSFGTVAL